MNTALATHSESLSNGTVLIHGSTASSPRTVEPRRRSTLLGSLALLVSVCSLLTGCVEGDGDVEELEDVGEIEEVEEVGEAAQAVSSNSIISYGPNGQQIKCTASVSKPTASSGKVSTLAKGSCTAKVKLIDGSVSLLRNGSWFAGGSIFAPDTTSGSKKVEKPWCNVTSTTFEGKASITFSFPSGFSPSTKNFQLSNSASYQCVN